MLCARLYTDVQCCFRAADGVGAVERKNVTLDADSIETLRAVGEGDLSLGIRRAAAYIKSSKAL